MTEAKNREERKPRANRQKLKYEVKDWPREQSDRTLWQQHLQNNLTELLLLSATTISTCDGSPSVIRRRVPPNGHNVRLCIGRSGDEVRLARWPWWHWNRHFIGNWSQYENFRQERKTVRWCGTLIKTHSLRSNMHMRMRSCPAVPFLYRPICSFCHSVFWLASLSDNSRLLLPTARVGDRRCFSIKTIRPEVATHYCHIK
jgi:hypothetical protein